MAIIKQCHRYTFASFFVNLQKNLKRKKQTLQRTKKSKKIKKLKIVSKNLKKNAVKKETTKY